MCIYNKSQSSHPCCCGSVGWLVLCAVTLSPCTSVELISLSLQLVITCSMRQYNILQSSVLSGLFPEDTVPFGALMCPLVYWTFLHVPYSHFLLFITIHSHHTISINELGIIYVAIGYTHTWTLWKLLLQMFIRILL